MAISINFNCSLRPSSPPKISPPAAHLVRLTSKDSIAGGLPSRCISIAAACLIIGCVDATDGGTVLAAEQPKYAEGLTERKIMRWSDKIRKCPPWRVNSLENIMPENLPRQSGRGRTDGFVSDQTAPAIGGPIRFNKGCYNL